jgi:hypothetical protein
MDRWYGTNELRQSWCLLTFDIDSREGKIYIKSCEVGEGNADQLIEVETLTAESPDEEVDLLQAIGTILDEHRYDEVTLITPTQRAVAILRTRFLKCNQIQKPTLRGFRHVALINLLTTHFSDGWEDQFPDVADQHRNSSDGISVEDRLFNVTNTSVETLWEVRTAIGPLVPSDSLQGRPL